MTCLACSKARSPILAKSDDCVQEALDKIRLHYLFLKKNDAQKQSKIQELEERNEKLLKAVELLQREQRSRNPPVSQWDTDEDDSFNDEGAEMPQFNIALQSEDLFNSSIDSAKNESIANSAHIDRRKKLQITRVQRKQHKPAHDKLVGIQNENKNPQVNEKPILEEDSKPKWLSKKSVTSSNTSLHAIENYKSPDCKPKQFPLSLTKGASKKLKQTLLDPVLRKNSLPQAADESPTKSYTVLKRQKTGSAGICSDSSRISNQPIKKTHVKQEDANDATKIPEPKVEVEFDIRMDDSAFVLPMHTPTNKDSTFFNNILPGYRQNANTSSIEILTPATPDIIFIDDTDMHIEADELEISKCMQKNAKNQAEVLANNRCFPNQFKKPNADAFNIKQECDEPEESEEFMVRPIIVKCEQMSSTKTTIKERFNIDCRDCEKYISFLGNDLSDEQIMAHLNKCSRHKNRDVPTVTTPPHFWNPLMESFPPDDPRNEVLVDDRFVGSKRVGRYGSKYI